MRVDFLAAADGTPLTKTFARDAETGAIVSDPYPHVRNFTSLSTNVKDIDEWMAALLEHSHNGLTMLKGTLDQPLVNASRAGHTQSTAPTKWIALDIDTNQGFADLDATLAAIHPDLPNTDRIVQYSASAGIKEPAHLRSHVFVMLTQSVTPALLKEWLSYVNLNNPSWRAQTTLSANGLALKYALDITTCQNDKLLYIAEPVLQDGITANLPNGRFVLVRGTSPTLDLHPATNLSQTNREQAQARIAELRDQLGLEPKAPKYRDHSGGEVILTNPDIATVTG